MNGTQSLFHISQLFWDVSKVIYFMHFTDCLYEDDLFKNCQGVTYPPSKNLNVLNALCHRCQTFQILYHHEQLLKNMYYTDIARLLGYDGFRQEYYEVHELFRSEFGKNRILHTEILLLLINARLTGGYNLLISNENLSDAIASASVDFINGLENTAAGIIWRYNKNIKIEFNRDPRGPSIKLFFKSGRNNSFVGSDGGYGLGLFYTEQEEIRAVEEFKKEVVLYVEYTAENQNEKP